LLNSFRAFKFENVIPLFGEKEYTLKKEKYEKSIWKCKICSEKFEDWYANGIEPRCPICNPYLGRFSILEKQIVDYIKFLNIENIIENSKKNYSSFRIRHIFARKEIGYRIQWNILALYRVW